MYERWEYNIILGYYPYDFNLKENYDYIGELPDVVNYGLKNLTRKKKRDLKQLVFVFRNLYM